MNITGLACSRFLSLLVLANQLPSFHPIHHANGRLAIGIDACGSYRIQTRNSTGDEIPALFCYTPLAFNASDGRVPPGRSSIFVKFRMEVKGWLRYKMAKNIAEIFNP